MLKDQTIKQMSLPEDSPANPSALQEKEKEQMTIDTSGMKLLELSENVNLDGSLGKMLKALLTSKTAWSSDRCVLTWKKKVSKSNVLLFQLQASVHGIKGKESGLWLTPTATDIAARSKEALEKRKEYRKSIGRNTTPPGNLAEQIQYGIATTNMFPTPSASCHMDVVAPETVKQNSKGWSVTRVGTGTKFGAKLNDVVNKINNKPGGKLNPHFVEFLMGYPMNWTKIEPTE